MVSSVSQFVERLLDEPIESSVALRHRLAEVDDAQIRKEVIERLECRQLEGRRLENAREVLATTGLDEWSRRRLDDIATSGRRDHEQRRLAFMALITAGRVDPMELVDGLDAEGMDELLAANLSVVLQHAERAPGVTLELIEQLREVTGPYRSELFEMIERTRRQLQLEAGLVYAAVFEQPDYEPLWPLVGEAVVEDGVAGDAPMLEEAAADADRQEVARKLRRQAMRLRTTGIEQQTRQRGFGLIGSCDGTGAYPAMVVRRRRGGKLDVINLLFRTTGAFRDAVILEFDDRDQLAGITEQLHRRAGAEFTEVSLPMAAGLLERRFDRAVQLEKDSPPELGVARQRIRRLSVADEQPPRVEPADELPSRRQFDALFDHRRYDHWHLNRAAVMEAGLEPPTPPDPIDEWVAEAVVRVAGIESVVLETASLAEHMALWHALCDEHTEAAQMAAVAAHTKTNPESSRLLRLRVKKTVAEWGAHSDDDEKLPVELVEDPDLRRYVRHRFFADADPPRGAEVLHLVLTCLVFVTLDWGMTAVEAQHQPRPDERYRLAHRLAERILSQLLRRSGPQPRQLHTELAEQLTDTGIKRRAATELADLILRDGQLYIDQHAGPEFFEALAEPRRPMPEAFFS